MKNETDWKIPIIYILVSFIAVAMCILFVDDKGLLLLLSITGWTTNTVSNLYILSNIIGKHE
jgi:hypothetical protein